MARGEESAAMSHQNSTSYHRQRRTAVVAVCVIACFAAVCGFVLNQREGSSAKNEDIEIRAGVSPKTPISAYHKLTSSDDRKEDAVDWAEEEAENKLIAGLEEKIRTKFTLEHTVDAQPLELVNRSDVEAELVKKLDEQRFKSLVAKITGEMKSVNGNLDALGGLRQKQQDLEDAIASVTDDINSDETKELFDEIARMEEEQPALETNGTACNGTNATDGDNCTGNETAADGGDGAGDEEAPAEEKSPAAQSLAAVRPRAAASAARAAAPSARKPSSQASTAARHVALFEDVARVLQDEEHRVQKITGSMKQLSGASGWKLH